MSKTRYNQQVILSYGTPFNLHDWSRGIPTKSIELSSQDSEEKSEKYDPLSELKTTQLSRMYVIAHGTLSGELASNIDDSTITVNKLAAIIANNLPPEFKNNPNSRNLTISLVVCQQTTDKPDIDSMGSKLHRLLGERGIYADVLARTTIVIHYYTGKDKSTKLRRCSVEKNKQLPTGNIAQKPTFFIVDDGQSWKIYLQRNGKQYEMDMSKFKAIDATLIGLPFDQLTNENMLHLEKAIKSYYDTPLEVHAHEWDGVSKRGGSKLLFSWDDRGHQVMSDAYLTHFNRHMIKLVAALKTETNRIGWPGDEGNKRIAIELNALLDSKLSPKEKAEKLLTYVHDVIYQYIPPQFIYMVEDIAKKALDWVENAVPQTISSTPLILMPGITSPSPTTQVLASSTPTTPHEVLAKKGYASSSIFSPRSLSNDEAVFGETYELDSKVNNDGKLKSTPDGK